MTEKWFCYDAMGDFHEFDTEAEALKCAAECIECCCEDHWDESVENIRVGKVTHAAVQTNLVERDMLDDEGMYNGRHYHGSADCWCDYEMREA